MILFINSLGCSSRSVVSSWGGFNKFVKDGLNGTRHNLLGRLFISASRLFLLFASNFTGYACDSGQRGGTETHLFSHSIKIYFRIFTDTIGINRHQNMIKNIPWTSNLLHLSVFDLDSDCLFCVFVFPPLWSCVCADNTTACAACSKTLATTACCSPTNFKSIPIVRERKGRARKRGRPGRCSWKGGNAVKFCPFSVSLYDCQQTWTVKCYISPGSQNHVFSAKK